MYRQYCYKVPYTYAQCMADCTPGSPGFEYECKPICWQYKTKPWYVSCPTHMAPYGMTQAAPYNSQPSYYPSTSPTITNDEYTKCVQMCLNYEGYTEEDCKFLCSPQLNRSIYPVPIIPSYSNQIDWGWHWY
ncbi:hypothetical protein CN675_08720 [Bacillus toyonensis]|nr:hypothetical protein CN675_08720 [Bacillus toyonensis]PEP08179.1 hypothetical protein CN577_11630 [Bacillus toyonensis]